MGTGPVKGPSAAKTKITKNVMKLKHLTFFLVAAALAAACGKSKEEQKEPEKPVVVEGKITLTVQDATVPAEGGTETISFEATKAWTASSSEGWLTIDPAKGEKGSATVTATIAANEGYDDRTATVTITCDKDSKTFTVTQKQKGDNPENPDNPDNPDQPVTPADGAELDCPNPPTIGTVDATALTGYGEKVTGGEGGTVLHFNSGKALQTWLLNRTKAEKKGDHSPVTIWLSGTFNNDEGRDFSSAHPWFDVKDVSNLSFIGTDSFVMNKIGIFCVRASNIIIRNINFQQPKANNGADAVSMQECDGVWVDHCTFTSLNQTKDYEDGSTDVTHGSKNVTVSWCRYIKTQKSCLVGHSNSQSSDTEITATFHHNWFEGSSSRHPRVRFGKAHVYNNFFDGNTTYGVGSAYGAKVLVEYNYFDGVQLPTDICTYPAKESGESNLQGSVAGYLYPTQNIYVNRPAKAKDPYPLSNVKYEKYGAAAGTELTYADFKPSYTYTVTAAEDVPAVVKAGAGYGKLGFTEAPVAVNNGGITDYDATDDNPTDPGQDDPDEPVTPVDDGAKTYTLYATGSKKVETTGGSYFDYTTDTADFRSPGEKAYNGPFTVNGTEYSFGVKMNSSGYVKFTTSSTYTTTVQFWYARRNTADTTAQMQLVPTGGEAVLFDTPFDTFADSGVITLEKGTEYTIKQKAKEQGLILIIVKENE